MYQIQTLDSRPGITGTLNQTGLSDADASTFDARKEAEEALAELVAMGAVTSGTMVVVGYQEPTVRNVVDSSTGETFDPDDD